MGKALSKAIKATSFEFKGNGEERDEILKYIKEIGPQNFIDQYESQGIKDFIEVELNAEPMPDAKDEILLWLSDLDDDVVVKIWEKLKQLKE
jgi:hypothetical protein